MTRNHERPNGCSPPPGLHFKPHLNIRTCKRIKTARYRPVVREFEHTQRVMDKKRRIEVLRALLEMHQQQHEPDDEYIKGLRQRLKGAQKQLENMRQF